MRGGELLATPVSVPGLCLALGSEIPSERTWGTTYCVRDQNGVDCMQAKCLNSSTTGPCLLSGEEES